MDGNGKIMDKSHRYIKQEVGVSHCGLAIYIKKYLKAKRRRIMETQIFHHANI
jgi:hypothetical protein